MSRPFMSAHDCDACSKASPARGDKPALCLCRGGVEQILEIIEQRRRGVDPAHGFLNFAQSFHTEDRLQFFQHFAAVHSEEHCAFARSVRHSQFDPHQETIKLRFRKRESADLMLGILRRNHEEGFRQIVSYAVRGDAVLFHCFKQRTLRFGGRAIHFVDQHQLREQWSTMKNEALLVPVENRVSENIRRQQIACELDALETNAERACEGLRKCGFSDAGNIFDEQVPAREQARDREPDGVGFADDDLTNLFRECIDAVSHSMMIGGSPRTARLRETLRHSSGSWSRPWIAALTSG